jgi:hypothetical protein
MGVINKRRLQFAIKLASMHLLLSALGAAAIAFFVFFYLYPWPYSKLLAVGGVFAIVLVVDVVCGPLMTFILANPSKRKREKYFDFFVVAIIQISALVYGVHSVWVARPVIMAFEKDRFVLIRANEVDIDKLSFAPIELRNLPFMGVMNVGVGEVKSNEELMRSLDLAMQGLSPAMRPDRWVLYSDVNAQIVKSSKPIEQLENKGVKSPLGAPFKYIPLTSGQVYDWVAIVDENGEIVNYLNVDGF